MNACGDRDVIVLMQLWAHETGYAALRGGDGARAVSARWPPMRAVKNRV